ncbi:MAG: DUF3553 domain-containing protein [Phycisphaerales bacterium]
MLVRQWSFGDRLVHAGRPEWGSGVVTSVQKDSYEGRVCQKLVIRFDKVGIKTISTALADLRAESEMPLHTMPEAAFSDDPLMKPLGPSPKELMLKIPENATDPFTTPKARIEAMCALYRFSDQGGSLLEWAIMQSGLRDPMTRFNRHELEELFKRWVMLRDEQFKKMIFEFKRNDPALLAQIGRNAPRGAQQLLKRLDALR